MAKGILIIRVQAADSALPVADTLIRVTDEGGEVMFEETVNGDGEGRSIELEAPSPEGSLEPGGGEPYTKYDVRADKDGYYTQEIRGIQMFGDETTTLPVMMIPLPEGENGDAPIVYPIGDNALLQDYVPQSETGKTGRILGEVYIPEFITVHLGSPSSSASNVTVPFVDYIKNVASSEIYPTWPENSLRANILAQISLALNRVFTEWYRSKGYDFDITNSTAYDQYYIYGRNIYDSVSVIVDEIFNNYIRKPGRIEPFYAEYCNGTSVSCPGMSQWGSVALANQGYSPLDILKFYYGELDLITGTDIRGSEESYPGSPLTLGSAGSPVRTLQEQLNRVAINYPGIPLQYPDGIYGENTAAAVRAFQRLFDLTADGVVGKRTWYRLSFVYTAVKKLSELTSEGQRLDYTSQAYPGVALRSGSVGSEVQELQFYLSRISAFNSAIPKLSIDGRYGASTVSAVRAFQSYYGLSADGIVGSLTWNKLVEVYNGTLDNVDEGEDIELRSYPGSLVSIGSSGSDVLYIQGLLNAISNVFAGIPKVAADGAFGPATAAAVTAFQETFGLAADGIVGRLTWDKLGSIYSAVISGCVNSPAAPSAEQYPGSPLRVGSEGNDVAYIQRNLKTIALVLQVIPDITDDGVFGQATRGAVVAFQRLFGLTVDGIVGKNTWSGINTIVNAVQNGCLGSATATASGEAYPITVEAVSSDVGFETDDTRIYAETRFPGKCLSVGCFGRDVLSMKRRLSDANGTRLSAIGDNFLFGVSTRRAVEDFQSREGLPVSGVVDSDTWNRLFSAT